MDELRALLPENLAFDERLPDGIQGYVLLPLLLTIGHLGYQIVPRPPDHLQGPAEPPFHHHTCGNRTRNRIRNWLETLWWITLPWLREQLQPPACNSIGLRVRNGEHWLVQPRYTQYNQLRHISV